MVGSDIPGVHDDRVEFDPRITPTPNGWKAIAIILGVFVIIGLITKVMI